MSEIMASLDDVNTYLNTEGELVVEADDTNSVKAQVSAARLIRGYLSRAVSATDLNAWSSPSTTPDIIREVAGLLIASQIFFDQTSAATLTIEERHYAQILYDRAIDILKQIVMGEIIIPDLTSINAENITDADFFPRDDTDRAFTMGMQL